MTTPMEIFLARVKHRRTGGDRCVFHDPTREDRHPSGAVRELDDGRLLIHLFNGTSTEAALSAIGLTFADLYPARVGHTNRCRRERRPFVPSDVFEIDRHEIGIAAVIAHDLATARKINEQDHARPLDAAARLSRIAEAAYGK